MEVDNDSGSRRLALIKAVRSLDEDATISLPDKIQKLWNLLSATKSSRFHGVEENILRWLFKHMSSNTEDAEQVRRYPLTWSILSHVFPKILPQTLGRSLASLRFVSVLHQTLGDITTARKRPALSNQTNGAPTDDDDAGKTKKRKRRTEFPSDLEELRTPEGCIKSATELFRTLNSLLHQGDHRTGPNAPERRVGCEHIKSLFSSSNEDTRDIAAKLILTCDRSLSVLDGGISQDQESWIGVVTNLWNLRLHNKDDSLEFARHMYLPVCSILTRLRGIAGVAPVVVASNAIKDLWIRQLEQFLSAYFIRPARHAFTINENIEVLEAALELTKRNLGGSAIITWDVAARTPRDSSNPKSKAEHLSWVQNVFGILLNAIQPLEPLIRNQVIIQLLDTAAQTNSVPSTAALRVVCREYALRSEETDWNLIAKAVASDADVFLMDDALINDVFGRVSFNAGQDADTSEIIVSEIILPLEDAFSKARNFSGFIQKWHNCLSKVATDSLDQSIWADARIRQRLSSILQTALTTTQLLRILESLDSTDSPSGALLVVLDGISAGINEEVFLRIADSKIFELAFKDKSFENIPPSILSLRWRIAGRMASWETSDEVDRLWAELKSILKRTLKKGALSNPETFEAFSCCHKLWLANYPEGKREAELAKIAISLLERLTSEMKAENDISVFRPYLDYTFRYLPKLAELQKQEATKLREIIGNLFWHVGQRLAVEGDEKLDNLLQTLLHNSDCEDEETLIDTLILLPFDALDSAEARSGWTQPQSLSLLLIILEFPQEALTKGRRKRIMSSWKKWRSAITTRASQDSRFAVAVLRLLVKVMQQPTFYEGMEFDDLVHICSNFANEDKNILAFIEKLVNQTLRQMVISSEEHSLAYLTEASNFVKNLKLEGPKITLAQMLLVKGVAAALHSTTTGKPLNIAISLGETTRKLERMVQSGVSEFASNSKRIKKIHKYEMELLLLSVALGAAELIAEVHGENPIGLTEKTIRQLEGISSSYISEKVSEKVDLGWKIRAFLFRNCPHRYDMETAPKQLKQVSITIDESLVYNLVDAFVKETDQDVRDTLLANLVGCKLTAGSIGPLLGVRRLVELMKSEKYEGILDIGAIYQGLVSLLSETSSYRHFKYLSEVLIILLDKQASLMSQFNIETTLSSIVQVCSQSGPRIEEPKAAGEIYDKLYKLTALVLRRHRLRLRGHFPILLSALRALLTTLLTDPNSATKNVTSPEARHPWLKSRLQSRHAERFTRLVTLICEPSAGAVARARSSELDSATDAAKRAAGQDMFTILELYIKLQLEVVVPRDIRKALEPGVYSILGITPQGCRRILNESLDANGRAIFRQMFADYKKFGKWSGV
ncbi:Urb2/Npa2 family-domain-containing protein [Hypoxylon trugodes]|uniref:Urb2/Npa2 family-domain-containing protein n=1 Tax=Hypoxylon trugodes TaxID=326681 RepID=UPI002197EF32|nr:Urb2/Npa2 family-domain-containing protein [Hypoxylon trugodes]KAI1384672.1 Urb2/Npa2 family-domain-containing protein [Hypoxylon trugodes]